MTFSPMTFRQDFETLKSFGADPAGGWSRPAFSPPDIAAHDWFLARGREVGLSARYDAFGNAILRYEGDGGPAILIGSHLDTVQNGGAFDGTIGVLAGLDVLRRLKVSGLAGAPVEAIAFRDEEGRFDPFTGSRAMAALHTDDTLARAKTADGETLAEAVARAGFALANAPRDWSEVAAYLELHIEQGPLLEKAGLSLGLVTAIAGQERLSLRFTGQADHAGTAPMDLRRDAFAGAARFAEAFRSLILSKRDPDLRGTIGFVKVAPNQGNVVPAQAVLGLEVRGTDTERLVALRTEIERLACAVAGEEGLEVTVRSLYSDGPVAMDARLRDCLTEAAEAAGVAVMDLPSGANHDAGVIGQIVPAAMLFVPSSGGRSHCPEEHTDLDQIEAGIGVLHRAVCALRVQPMGRRP